MVLEDFDKKKVKKTYGCNTLNNTSVPLIIKNLGIPLIKFQNSILLLIISQK